MAYDDPFSLCLIADTCMAEVLRPNDDDRIGSAAEALLKFDRGLTLADGCERMLFGLQARSRLVEMGKRSHHL